mmetsp:Transcript_66157/g.138188  ORF Transcript_66157/g.138188 Transcript_66157/m.138188 type:complete len:580 (-) Transcript_66157:102-1841(-)
MQRRGPTFKRTQRSATAPASLLEDVLDQEEVSANFQGLHIPESAEVRKQLSQGGSNTTVRDLALGIVKRLLENPANDASEVRFLGECLKAGASCTALPCALLRHSNSVDKLALADYLGGDEVQSFIMRSQDSPSMSGRRSASSSFNMRGSSSHRSGGSNDKEDQVPRWPVSLSKEYPSLEVLEGVLGEEFQSWGIDVFELSMLTKGRELQFVGWEALRQGDFFAEFDLSTSKAHKFLQRVEAAYADAEVVPYHNARHAADVTQSVHALLRNLGFGGFFDSTAAFSLVLSAIVHDMGHDGRNNLYHINVQDDFALTWNDRSVLENFHVSQAFKILSAHPEANILDVFDKESSTAIRKDMIENVLTTDMSMHFRTVETLKNYVERLETLPADWAAETGALSSLQGMLLHSADIGNMGKTIPLADKWTKLLRQEFHAQGDLEKASGLPISPLCDRAAGKFASSQVGFIQFIVQPTFDVLSALSSSVEEVVVSQITANLNLWSQRKADEIAEEEEAAKAEAAQAAQQTECPADSAEAGNNNVVTPLKIPIAPTASATSTSGKSDRSESREVAPTEETAPASAV